MKVHTATLLIALGAAANGLEAGPIFPGLYGKPLIDSLRKYYKTTRTLSDADCRDTLYGEIDLTGDSLTCVYCGWTIHGGPTADPSAWANSNDINPEHTWPQSYLDSTRATQDMHHLFPTEMQVNNDRGNYPFGEIDDGLTTYWYLNNNRTTGIPSSNIDAYSEFLSNTRFEPREVQKGRTARAMYYVLTFWQIQDTTLPWWTGQRDTLYLWHCQHPADAAESTRTWRIAAHQANKPNPFVLDSTLVRRCYFPPVPTNTRVSFASAGAAYGEAAGTVSLTVNIANPSASAATTVDVVLAGGTGTAADVNNYTAQSLTFPAGSSSPQTASVTITDDALYEGTETLVFKLRNASGGDAAEIVLDSAFTMTVIDNEAIPGDLLLYEPFDYPAGDNISAHGWTAHSGAGTNPPKVISPGLSFGGYKAKAANACSLFVNGEDDNRSFNPQSSGAVYASFLVSVDSAQYPGDYFLHLSTSPLDNAYYVGRVYVKRDAAYNLAFGLAKAAEGAKYSDSIYARKTTYLLVLKYIFFSGAANDSVSLYVIGGAIPPNEPATPTLGPFGAVSNDPNSIGTVALRQGTAGNAAVLKVDEIKVGTSWYRAPLPVQLAGFTATADAGRVTLDWRTESENGSYMWIVERSLSAEGGYAELGRLPAAGSSTSPCHYTWTDRTAEPGQDYYYRLGEIWLDGATIYYGPVACGIWTGRAVNDLLLACAPNPFRKETSISFQAALESRGTISIFNAAGQLVMNQDLGLLRAGQHHARWDGTDGHGAKLSSGVYFVRLALGQDTRQARVLLVR